MVGWESVTNSGFGVRQGEHRGVHVYITAPPGARLRLSRGWCSPLPCRGPGRSPLLHDRPHTGLTGAHTAFHGYTLGWWGEAQPCSTPCLPSDSPRKSP